MTKRQLAVEKFTASLTAKLVALRGNVIDSATMGEAEDIIKAAVEEFEKEHPLQVDVVLDDLSEEQKQAGFLSGTIHKRRPTLESDRESLNAFLDKVRYRRAGDVVYLRPFLVSRTAETNKPGHAAVAVMGTVTVDGIGFQQHFRPDGIGIDRFRKNPIVLYDHDYEGLPVARSLWERVRDGTDGPEFVAKPQFHMDTELSREVWALVESGKLCTWELGVVPVTWEKRGDGYYVTAWDVLEFSVVPRPEDMAQLREERRRRRISSPALVKSIMEEGEVDIV